MERRGQGEWKNKKREKVKRGRKKENNETCKKMIEKERENMQYGKIKK